MKKIYLFSLVLLLGLTAQATRSRHKRWQPLLPKVAGAQLRQNQEIDRLRLPRVVDDLQLQELINSGELVKIPDDIELAPNLQGSRTFVRPWTAKLLEAIGEDFRKTFGSRLRVNSAIRTEEQQRALRKHNHYAAPVGETSHTSGMTVDLAKRTLTRQQYRWLVEHLKYLRDMGVIEAQEEPQCFHVAVMERYNGFDQKDR